MSFSEYEIEAIEKTLPGLGQHVAQSGIMDKPFSQCSRDEILALVANTVRTFRGELHQIFDREGIAW